MKLINPLRRRLAALRYRRAKRELQAARELIATHEAYAAHYRYNVIPAVQLRLLAHEAEGGEA